MGGCPFNDRQLPPIRPIRAEEHEPLGIRLAAACHSSLNGSRDAGTNAMVSNTPRRLMALGGLVIRYGRYGVIGSL